MAEGERFSLTLFGLFHSRGAGAGDSLASLHVPSKTDLRLQKFEVIKYLSVTEAFPLLLSFSSLRQLRACAGYGGVAARVLSPKRHRARTQRTAEPGRYVLGGQRSFASALVDCQVRTSRAPLASGRAATSANFGS